MSSCKRCSFFGCVHGDHSTPMRSLYTHVKFHIWLRKQDAKRKFRKWLRSFTALDYSKVEDVEIDGIDTRDDPDFCDAYVASATYKGREMTDAELDRLNEDRDYVYQKTIDRLF